MSTAHTTSVTGPRWTPTLVAKRIAEAVDVLERLPEPRMPGLYSLWPTMPDERCDGGQGRPASPPPEAIDRMDEALRWLCWLEPDERRIVWLRAEGVPWKRITYRVGVGRTTAWQKWTVALLKVATRLNAAAEQERPNIKTLNKPGLDVLQEH